MNQACSEVAKFSKKVTEKCKSLLSEKTIQREVVGACCLGFARCREAASVCPMQPRGTSGAAVDRL